MNFWLVKSDPKTYSWKHFLEDKSTVWDGVRNYQARNFMRDEMKRGDQILFYHSSCKVPGVAGIAKVEKKAVVDHTFYDPKNSYFDTKSTKENPRWLMVYVKHVKSFKRTIPLKELKEHSELKEMKLLQKGCRLSIMPVSKEEFEFILGLE